MIRILLCALSLLTVACQMKPTRTGSSEQREFDLVVNKSTKPIELNDNMVVLDARPAFDYGLNRVIASHHFPWENLAESAETGEVLRDKRKLAQRAALLGLTPTTPVVVIGNGPSGSGEEGRLAWTLLYMGFKDVQTASVEMFRKNLTQMATPPPKNAPPADLETEVAMVTSKAEFQRVARDPKLRLENKIWILDVRSEKEYTNKPAGTPSKPDISALNVDWKQFYTANGRPDSNMRKKLKALGINENDRLVIISNRGVRSASAAYALISMGFTRVENFLPGWRSL